MRLFSIIDLFADVPIGREGLFHTVPLVTALEGLLPHTHISTKTLANTTVAHDLPCRSNKLIHWNSLLAREVFCSIFPYRCLPSNEESECIFGRKDEDAASWMERTARHPAGYFHSPGRFCMVPWIALRTSLFCCIFTQFHIFITARRLHFQSGSRLACSHADGVRVCSSVLIFKHLCYPVTLQVRPGGRLLSRMCRSGVQPVSPAVYSLGGEAKLIEL